MARDPKDKLILTTGGYQYVGWLAVNVTRSLEEAVSTFELSLTEDTSATGDRIRPRLGTKCTIDIGETRVLTGYIDSVDIAHDGGSHTVEVTGRSRTQDLVDCSIVTEPFQYRDRSLLDIATVLAAPYKVPVLDEREPADPVVLIKRFVCETGETPFEATERLARHQQALVTDNEYGELVLTTVGQLDLPPLTHPGNILRARLRADISGRYSEYVVKAQTVEDDENYGEVVSGIDALIADDEVPRYRALVIKGERAMSAADAKRRATWEAVTRAGKSAQVEIAVRGWRAADGLLWQTNGISRVKDAVIGVDADLLVVQVSYSYDEVGERTEMLLAPPGGYTPIPPNDQRTKGRKKRITADIDLWDLVPEYLRPSNDGTWPELAGGA